MHTFRYCIIYLVYEVILQWGKGYMVEAGVALSGKRHLYPMVRTKNGRNKSALLEAERWSKHRDQCV